MHGVAFPDKDTQTPIPDEFTVAYEGFMTNARGTEALDDMFAIGREAEFTQGTTSLTRKAQEALDSRIRSNTERDILNGAMTVPAEIDQVIESPLGWRARVRSMMQRRNNKPSLMNRIHDSIGDTKETGGRKSRLIASLVIGAIATGSAYWNLDYEKGVVDTKPRTEEVRTHEQADIDEIVPITTDAHATSPTVVTPPKLTASQEFHENYDSLSDTGKEEFKDMMKWEDTFIDNNNLEVDPKRNEKAVNAFVRGLRYMKSLTKRVR